MSIEPEPGPVKGASGSVYVTPTKDTKYTLIAKSGAGTKTQDLTVAIEKPAAAAPQPPTTTPTPAGSDDASAIKDILEHRWKHAFETQNIGEAKVIFPGIPKSTQEAIKGARGIMLDLNCSPSINGDSATATCGQSITMNGKAVSGGRSVMFTLSKSSGTWLIQSSR